MRLNVFIAKSGFSSRRKAVSLIKEGKVCVNEKIVCEPWYEVKEKDSVRIDGKTISSEKNIYIVFNKPRGVTVTLKDKFAKVKIVDFIPKHFGRVYPVGRLDKNSRGLIILTNDGDFCHRLTHPKFEVEKEYLIWVKGRISDIILDKLKKGIKDGSDILKVKLASIETSKGDKTQVRVVVCEGKKRHLRRLFKGLGFSIIDLKRVRIGNFKLGDLKEGTFKIIDKKI